MICPNCGSEAVHRSKRRGMGERVVLSAVGLLPYRCSACHTRFRRYHPDPARELRHYFADAPEWVKHLAWSVLAVAVGLAACLFVLFRIAR